MSSRLSDYIEAFIRESLAENDGIFEFNRNVIANSMNCVPSQISYVIATRFTNDNGFIVESRRGGKGSIVIRQIFHADDDNQNLYAHFLTNLPEQISEHQLGLWLDNLAMLDLVDPKLQQLLKTLGSNNTLAKVPLETRKFVRADLVKALICELADQDLAEH